MSPVDAETTAPDPVLTAERAHLARAADCRTEMRSAAAAITDAGVDAWAAERLGAARADRLRALAADPGVPPFFGRTDTAARVLLPHAAGLEALFTGGDRGLVDEVLADRRLAPLAALRRDPPLDVGEPTKAVLLETPQQFRAVDVTIVEPGDRPA